MGRNSKQFDYPGTGTGGPYQTQSRVEGLKLEPHRFSQPQLIEPNIMQPSLLSTKQYLEVNSVKNKLILNASQETSATSLLR